MLATMTDITAEVEMIGPEEANALLARNKHNRPLRQNDVLKWATEMEAGNWQLNGEAIKVDADGWLIDGQHRLEAVSLQTPGTKVPFLVVRGLEPEAQKTMDQGRTRSTADQLVLAGVRGNGSIASAAKVYLIFKRGLLFRDSKVQRAEVTTPTVVQWAMENPQVMELFQCGNAYKKIKARTGVILAAYALIAEVHGNDKADEFFGRTLDGVGLELGSPILALRNRLDALNGELVRAQKQFISDRDLLATIFVTFNHWIAGKSLGRVQRPNGATWTAENFPKLVDQDWLKRSQAAKKGISK